jgi:DNA polymerase III epsilon subunit-like protein
MDLIFLMMERIHGISTELAAENGISLAAVLEKFNEALGKAKFIVGQKPGFDLNIMGSEFHRLGVESKMRNASSRYLYGSYRFVIKITRRSWRTI